MSDQSPIVLDFGSFSSKAGVSGASSPASVFYTAESLKTPPIVRGRIREWDQMEELIAKGIKKALVKDHNQDSQSILMVDSIHREFEDKKMISEILFESHNSTSVFFELDALLSLYSTGNTQGLVVSSGAGYSCAVPIYDGKILGPAIHNMNIAGQDISCYLKSNLPEKLDPVLEQIKKNACYVAYDFELEVEEYEVNTDSSIKYEYVLPDGNFFLLQDERFKSPEILFQPVLRGEYYRKVKDNHYNSIMLRGLPYLAYAAAMDCERDLRLSILSNVVLSGGSTMLKGFVERFEKELSFYHCDVKLICEKDRELNSWLGGSLMASLPDYHNSFVTKDEWNEAGIEVFRRKYPPMTQMYGFAEKCHIREFEWNNQARRRVLDEKISENKFEEQREELLNLRSDLLELKVELFDAVDAKTRLESQLEDSQNEVSILKKNLLESTELREKAQRELDHMKDINQGTTRAAMFLLFASSISIAVTVSLYFRNR